MSISIEYKCLAKQTQINEKSSPVGQSVRHKSVKTKTHFQNSSICQEQQGTEMEELDLMKSLHENILNTFCIGILV